MTHKLYVYFEKYPRCVITNKHFVTDESNGTNNYYRASLIKEINTMYDLLEGEYSFNDF